MSLQEVVYRSTYKSAKVLHRNELGHLSIDTEADLAVFALQEVDFAFVESGRARMQGHQKIEYELPLRAGEVVWDLNCRSHVDWQ